MLIASGIMILNIRSWAGGCDPWGKREKSYYKHPKMNDGQFEVVGLKGRVQYVLCPKRL